MSEKPKFKSVTIDESLTAVAMSRSVEGLMSDDVAYTIRLLLMQFFRPSGHVGEYADQELVRIYDPSIEEEPMEAEIIAFSKKTRDMIIGPINEDTSHPDFPKDRSYIVTVDRDDGPIQDPQEEQTGAAIAVECVD